MTAGILAALGAGVIWGFVFIAPVIAHAHAPWTLALTRYTIFGIVSLLFFQIFVPAAQKRALWSEKNLWKWAFWLALVGNLIYYTLLAIGIQRIGVPLVTLVIGTLPIVVSVVANARDRSVRWRVLALPLLFIFVGFLLAREGEMAARALSTHDFAIGMLGAVGALIAWTIYPIYNARFIEVRSDVPMMAWACAQGIALLPLVAILLVLTHFWGGVRYRLDAGDLNDLLLAAGIAGILSSWLGTWLWNIASQQLPAALAGQLIIFETIFSLLYGFAIEQRWPKPIVVAGIAFMLIGVLVGVRAFHREKQIVESAKA